MTAQIKMYGVKFDIEFDYQPAEKMVMYYKDGSGYPGCQESFEITEITIDDLDFYELFESNGLIEEVIEQLKNQES